MRDQKDSPTKINKRIFSSLQKKEKTNSPLRKRIHPPNINYLFLSLYQCFVEGADTLN